MQPLNFNATSSERRTPCFAFVTSGPILILKSLCYVASLNILDSKLGRDPLSVLQKDVVALPLWLLVLIYLLYSIGCLCFLMQ